MLYNTELVNGVMSVLDKAGLFALDIHDIIKYVEEKITSDNSENTPCPKCGYLHINKFDNYCRGCGVSLRD